MPDFDGEIPASTPIPNDVVAIIIDDDDGNDIFYHVDCVPTPFFGGTWLTQKQLNQYIESNDEGAVCEGCGYHI